MLPRNVVKNFAKLIGKHLFWSFFFINFVKKKNYSTNVLLRIFRNFSEHIICRVSVKVSVSDLMKKLDFYSYNSLFVFKVKLKSEIQVSKFYFTFFT